MNFDFSPYKIKLNVFILTKKIILFFVPNGYNFDVLLIFFEHNINIYMSNIINGHNMDTI